MKLRSSELRLITLFSMFRPSSCICAALLVYKMCQAHSLDLTCTIICTLFFVFVIAGTFAVNAGKDYLGDVINTPTRPVARGSISIHSAYAWGATGFGGALLFCLLLPNIETKSLGLLIIALSGSYSFFWSHHRWYKNIGVAIVTTSMILIPACASEIVSMRDGLWSTLLFSFILQREIIADTRDIIGDRATGKRTLVSSIPTAATALNAFAGCLSLFLVSAGWAQGIRSGWFSAGSLSLFIANSILTSYIVGCRKTDLANYYLTGSKISYLFAIFCIV